MLQYDDAEPPVKLHIYSPTSYVTLLELFCLRIYPLVLINLMTPAKLAPDLGILGCLWSVKMVPVRHFEADIHLRLLPTSLLDTKKVFEPLLCCLKGIWVHPYTVTPAKLAPDLGIRVHLWSENDVIMSWLRLISTSDSFIHPYYAYRKCLSKWYAVSRECGCNLIPSHQPSWPQIWGFRFTCGVKMMSLRHG